MCNDNKKRNKISIYMNWLWHICYIILFIYIEQSKWTRFILIWFRFFGLFYFDNKHTISVVVAINWTVATEYRKTFKLCLCLMKLDLIFFFFFQNKLIDRSRSRNKHLCKQKFQLKQKYFFCFIQSALFRSYVFTTINVYMKRKRDRLWLETNRKYAAFNRSTYGLIISSFTWIN